MDHNDILSRLTREWEDRNSMKLDLLKQRHDALAVEEEAHARRKSEIMRRFQHRIELLNKDIPEGQKMSVDYLGWAFSHMMDNEIVAEPVNSMLEKFVHDVQENEPSSINLYFGNLSEDECIMMCEAIRKLDLVVKKDTVTRVARACYGGYKFRDIVSRELEGFEEDEYEYENCPAFFHPMADWQELWTTGLGKCKFVQGEEWDTMINGKGKVSIEICLIGCRSSFESSCPDSKQSAGKT